MRLGQKCLGFEQNRTMSKIVFQILSNRDGICRESYFWDTVYRFPKAQMINVSVSVLLLLFVFKSIIKQFIN